MRAIASILLPAIELPFAPFSPLFAFHAVHCELLSSLSLSLFFFISFSPSRGVCFADCWYAACGQNFVASKIRTYYWILAPTIFDSLTFAKKMFQQTHVANKRSKNLQVSKRLLGPIILENWIYFINFIGQATILCFKFFSYFNTRTIEIKCCTLIVSLGLISTIIFQRIHIIYKAPTKNIKVGRINWSPEQYLKFEISDN